MNEKYWRPVTLEVMARLHEPVRRIVVVAGPRQIGKTTAIHQVLRERSGSSCAFYASDAPEPADERGVDYGSVERVTGLATGAASHHDRSWVTEKWHLARRAAVDWHLEQLSLGNEATGLLLPYVLVFDEIQHVRDWSGVVKGLWDEDRAQGLPMHVVVLGSAPILMQRGLSESLMGRFEPIEMTHWSYSEMRDCFGFTLDQYLYFGGYPGPAHWVLEDQETRWHAEVLLSLVEPNLVKDILALKRIEKPAVLRQLFQLGCTYSGQVVSMTKLLAQLNDAGNTTTLTEYLHLLRVAGLLAGLEKYAAQAIRQRAAPPKLNVLNNAFLAVFSGRTFAQARADASFWGHLVESSIGAHLLNSAGHGVRVGYWRESPQEVDFVVYQGDRVGALEVKSVAYDMGARKGLRSFAERHQKMRVRTEVLGGDDFALADALSVPASHWLPE
ncbi:ATP-binding protein [Hydrogenophaga sp.]|uniref:ATP-binding protein n=1 Tax=Hydrogenophaga sp. TaxID=1904254 RepID=UPI00271E7425|nr:AAA family ATPase [Hydrogenophaga sp.]MDO9434319.1 AAA family ATPase [Hydrogenophaga sp.]